MKQKPGGLSLFALLAVAAAFSFGPTVNTGTDEKPAAVASKAKSAFPKEDIEKMSVNTCFEIPLSFETLTGIATARGMQRSAATMCEFETAQAGKFIQM